VLGKKENEESDYERKEKSSLNYPPESTLLEDIPALERDDPRIERANSEGAMENYEVKTTVEFTKIT
jgi:hypothetical protein